MNSFSISELQQFSGIRAHTIRIWEQRYNALTPGRSEGNTRYYDGHQLRRLLNIVSLLNTDHKVSELCAMTDDKLYKLLDQQLSSSIAADQTQEYFISQIVLAAVEFNELYFDKIFSNAILRYGIQKAYTLIIYPVLVRLGLLWTKDSIPPAQEHFITSLFRQKLLSAIDAIPPPRSDKNSWLLFLPEDELHETGLLFANFLIRQSGRKVIYLGANVPFESLKGAVKGAKPASLLFFLVRKNAKENDQQFLSLLGKEFSDLKIYVACEPSRLTEIKKSKNIIPLYKTEDLEKELK